MDVDDGYGAVRVWEGGGAWRHRRNLRAWEEDLLLECQLLLHDMSLQDDSLDR